MVIIGIFMVNDNGTFTIIETNDRRFTSPNLRAEIGPQGQPGPTGTDGQPGADGDKGNGISGIRYNDQGIMVVTRSGASAPDRVINVTQPNTRKFKNTEVNNIKLGEKMGITKSADSNQIQIYGDDGSGNNNAIAIIKIEGERQETGQWGTFYSARTPGVIKDYISGRTNDRDWCRAGQNC
jgi:hypothetical protein